MRKLINRLVEMLQVFYVSIFTRLVFIEIRTITYNCLVRDLTLRNNYTYIFMKRQLTLMYSYTKALISILLQELSMS